MNVPFFITFLLAFLLFSHTHIYLSLFPSLGLGHLWHPLGRVVDNEGGEAVTHINIGVVPTCHTLLLDHGILALLHHFLQITKGCVCERDRERQRERQKEGKREEGNIGKGNGRDKGEYGRGLARKVRKLWEKRRDIAKWA